MLVTDPASDDGRDHLYRHDRHRDEGRLPPAGRDSDQVSATSSTNTTPEAVPDVRISFGTHAV
ncbi:hypothetical protein BCL76_113192 [Streptomyces sp. CG 926]|nr:hypothetical protein BCL76_113192 [Streptomyces sp. CG 926]